jgi:hypothetical protein
MPITSGGQAASRQQKNRDNKRGRVCPFLFCRLAGSTGTEHIRWNLQLEKSKDLSGRLTCYELADNSASTLGARPGCFQVIGPGANYQQGRQKKVKRGADMHELCTLSWGVVCFPLLNRRTSLYPVASSSHQTKSTHHGQQAAGSRGQRRAKTPMYQIALTRVAKSLYSPLSRLAGGLKQ